MGIRTAKVAVALAVLLAGTGTNGVPASRGRGEVRMELYDGYLIVVEGRAGGLDGLQFLLDTGVTRSVIDRRVAEKLALPRWTATVINFDKAVKVESAEMPEISFGPEQAFHLKMTVADLGYLSAGGLHIDAVIGWDLLGRKSFRLDFAKKLVVFEPSEPQRSKGRKSALIRPNEWFLMIETYVDGKPVWMVADTGTQGVTFYQERLSSIGARYTVRGEAIGRSLSAIDARLADLQGLRLGPQDLGRTVHLIHSPASGAIEGIAGYLGFATLNARQVDFNFETNEMTWVN